MIARSVTVVGAGVTAIVAALLSDSWGTAPVMEPLERGPLALPAGWLAELAKVGGLLGVLAVLVGTFALARPASAPRIAPAAATALALGTSYLAAWLASSPGVDFAPAAYVATAALGVSALVAATLLVPAKPRPDPRLEVLRDVLARGAHAGGDGHVLALGDVDVTEVRLRQD